MPFLDCEGRPVAQFGDGDIAIGLCFREEDRSGVVKLIQVEPGIIGRDLMDLREQTTWDQVFQILEFKSLAALDVMIASLCVLRDAMVERSSKWEIESP